MYCGTGPPSPFVSKNGARYQLGGGGFMRLLVVGNYGG